MEKPSGKPKDTLCFECGRCDCSWMRNLEPVPGWEAERHTRTTKIKGKEHKSDSYRVISCPEYRRATTEDKHIHDTEGAMTLLSVIATSVYKEYITAKLWLNRNPDDNDAKRDLRNAKEKIEKGYIGIEFPVSVEKLDRLIGKCTSMKQLKERGLKK